MNIKWRFLPLLLFLEAACIISSPAQLTWGANGAGGWGNWDNSTANWYTGSANKKWVPGDIATFAGASGTVFPASGITASGLIFNSSGYTIFGNSIYSTANFTVQTNVDATLELTLHISGSFTKSGPGTLTFGGNLTVAGTANVAGGIFKITNTNSSGMDVIYNFSNVAGAELVFDIGSGNTYSIGALSGGGSAGGSVTVGSTAGITTLELEDETTNEYTYSGCLQDNGADKLALIVGPYCHQTLTGANTFSGPTQESGPLILSGNGSLLNTPITLEGILTLDNGTINNTNRLSDTIPLISDGGFLVFQGQPSGSSSELIGTLTLNKGVSEIQVNAGAGGSSVVTFAGLSRVVGGGTVNFYGTGFSKINGASNTDGILGPYATILAPYSTYFVPEWAALNPQNEIVAYAGYATDLNAATATDNVKLTGGGMVTLEASKIINSLNIQDAADSEIVDLGTNPLDISGGGLLLNSSTNSITIQNGSLTSSGGELIVTSIPLQVPAKVTVTADITDSSVPVSLTKSGDGNLYLSGVNTYSGATNVQRGSLVINQPAALPSTTVLNLSDSAGVSLVNGATISGLAGTAYGNLGILAGTLTVDNATDTFYEGWMAGPGGLTKTGSGTLELSGQLSYTGPTRVSAGALLLDEGELSFGTAVLSQTTPVILAGGTLAIDTPLDKNITQQVGALTLQSPSTIDFVNNHSVTLFFADSSSATWNAGQLSIKHFNPTIDKLRFGGSSAGLTAAQLAQIVFPDINNMGAQIDASGYVTPITQAATVILGGLNATYDGTDKYATATTNPPGLHVTFTYNGGSTYPINAGSYTVVATVNDGIYLGTATDTMVIAKKTASVVLGNLTAAYDKASHAVTANTIPPNLSVTYTYNGNSAPPVNAGSYNVVGTVNDPNYTGGSSDTLVIAKAAAKVTLGSLSATYNNTPHAATATTVPAGMNVVFTYDGNPAAPTDAGSYDVAATIDNPNYAASANGTLVIAPIKAKITLGSLSATYDGTPKSATATTVPQNLPVNFTYSGSPVAPANAGTYTVVGTTSNPNYTASTTGTLVIKKQVVQVAFVGAHLNATYNGSPQSVAATTTPGGLAVNITYDGQTTPPTNAGSYKVVATINENNYAGEVADTFLVAKKYVEVFPIDTSFVYDGQPHAATARTIPPGLNVDFSYDGDHYHSTKPPVNAGVYDVNAGIDDPNYTGGFGGGFQIFKATVPVQLGGLSAVYNGKPHPATVTTTLKGYVATFYYDPGAILTPPTLAGSYQVQVFVNTTNYTGTATGTMTISPIPPVATTSSSTAITTIGAMLNGTVNPSGNSGSAYFLYGTDTNYGSQTASQNFAAGTVNLPLSIPLIGLTPNTTYHYRLVATGAGGSGSGADKTFTTLPLVAPTVTFGPIVDIATVGAVLNGTVSTKGSETTAHFEYGTSLSYGNPTADVHIPENIVSTGVQAILGGLSPNTIYHYRIIAINAGGTFTTVDKTFKTAALLAPVVATSSPNGVTTTTGTLKGTVNPEGSSTSYHFDYGTTNSYGSGTAEQGAGELTSNVPAYGSMQGLQPDTTYHYRLVATNTGGVSVSTDKTFRTKPLTPPTATTGAATNIGSFGATVAGTVNTRQLQTAVHVNYGTTTSMGRTTGVAHIAGAAGPESGTFNLAGLYPNTKYYYQFVATNEDGTATGSIKSFTTAKP